MTDRAKPKRSAKNLPQYLFITDSKRTTPVSCLKQDSVLFIAKNFCFLLEKNFISETDRSQVPATRVATRVAELNYRIDICCVTKGAHIEHL
jgi:hypothetical protein